MSNPFALICLKIVTDSDLPAQLARTPLFPQAPRVIQSGGKRCSLPFRLRKEKTALKWN